MKQKKINLLVPIAGRGSRFLEQGIKIPKQLLIAGGKKCIDWSLESIDLNDFNLIFIIRDEHKYNFSYDKILKNKYKNCKIITLKNLTRGSVESCLYAEKFIDNDDPLAIFTMDVCFRPILKKEMLNQFKDGGLLTFKSNSSKYSYALIDKNNFVLKTAEKETISNNAIAGIYYFKKGSDLIKYGKEMIKKNIVTRNEFYLAPLYNLLINDKKKINTKMIDSIHIFGTPEELDFFENYVLRLDKKEPIGLSADHSGYEVKEIFKKELERMNIKFVDYGCYTNDNCDYNDFTRLAVDGYEKKDINKCFLFCRTGQGMNIAASRNKSIISAIIYDTNSLTKSIEHNCANFFSLPSAIWQRKDQIKKIIKIIGESKFEGGRHQNRVMKFIYGHEI